MVKLNMNHKQRKLVIFGLWLFSFMLHIVFLRWGIDASLQSVWDIYRVVSDDKYVSHSFGLHIADWIYYPRSTWTSAIAVGFGIFMPIILIFIAIYLKLQGREASASE